MPPIKNRAGSSFTQVDRRILLQKLEKYYVNELHLMQFHLEHPRRNEKPTNAAIRQRRFRLHIKAIELVLYQLGSQFFQNVERPSIRRTTELAAEHNGALHGKRSQTRNNRRVMRMRDS